MNSPTVKKSWISRLLSTPWPVWAHRFYCSITAIFVVGLLTRWTVQDSVLLLRTFFYATPPLFLLILAILSVLHCVYWKRKKETLAWALAVLILLPWWISKDWKSLSAAPIHTREELDNSQEISVIFWNVARKDDLTPAAEYVQRFQPDLVGFVEVEGDVDERRRFWRAKFPDYSVSMLGGGMVLMARGESSETTVHTLDQISHMRQLSITIRGVAYECFVVDIWSSLFLSRQAALDQVTEIVSRYENQPVIIMGDFNIPIDSNALLGLRMDHQEVFETIGSGYSPTWPIPIPAMRLDQIWVNKHVEPIACDNGWHRASDHRPVHATLRTFQKTEPPSE